VHLFTLKNTSNASVNIAGIRGTCGCEHMALYQNGHELPTLVVQPGQQFQALLGIHVDGQPPGTISKGAWIFGGASGTQTLAALTLAFRVRQSVYFEPNRLELGDIPAGGTVTASVKVHVDKMANWKSVVAPTLVGDVPGMTATQVGKPISEVRDGRVGAVIEYSVSLGKQSTLGPFTSSFHTSWSDKVPAPPSTYAFPISYRIIGNLAVVPQALNFGVVKQGTPATRSLIVIGSSVDSLTTSKVVSTDSWLHVNGITNVQPYRSGASGIATVVLTDAPAGDLKTILRITTADGQAVQVPVNATVSN